MFASTEVASPAATEGKTFGISNRHIVIYGLPGLPLAAVTLPVYIQIPAFYAVEMGLGLAVVGSILLMTRLWDVITDPLIGFLSDRVSTPIGRRKPWLVIGMPLTAVAGYLLFSPPDGIGPVYLFCVTLMLYLGWTMAMLPYSAWGAELSPDYHRRTIIAGWREGFVIVGTLLAAAMPAILNEGAGSQRYGLSVLAITLVVLLPVTCLIVAFGLPDRKPAKRTPLRLFETLGSIRLNKPFWRLIMAWFINGFANGLPATLFLIFVEFRLEAPDQAGILLLVYFLSAIFGLPIWVALGKRWGKHRCWSVAMIWACLWFAIVPFLEPGDVTAFMVMSIATGLALGADLVLPSSMQADVVDIDTAKAPGSPKTGAYFALWGMAQKLALALSVGIAFPLLALAGFDPANGLTEGIWLIAVLYGIAPIIFKLLAVLLIWNHPVTKASQQELQNTISGV